MIRNLCELEHKLKTELRIPESDAMCEDAPVSMYQVESGGGCRDKESNW